MAHSGLGETFQFFKKGHTGNLVFLDEFVPDAGAWPGFLKWHHTSEVLQYDSEHNICLIHKNI